MRHDNPPPDGSPGDALHARVRRFIDGPPGDLEDFDRLAADIARFQARACPPVARLYAARGVDPAKLASASQIPAVPTDAFKLTRIAAHPPEQDAIVFRTSGTTLGARGEHALRTTTTYEAAALAFGRLMLPSPSKRLLVAALAPPPAEAPDSSLGFMCRLFGVYMGQGARFYLGGGRLDEAALERDIEDAGRQGQPVLLLTTSFALVHLLDARAGRALRLPPGSRVMQTGGFKGRSRALGADELREAAASLFGIDRRAVVAEYGMTELSSQAYEGTLRALLGETELAGPEGLLFAPAWMRVIAVDPVDLQPVPPGETGIARIVDLANVDSAVALQTQDQVRAAAGGFELLGRLPGAPPRGCSLAIEELLAGSAR